MRSQSEHPTPNVSRKEIRARRRESAARSKTATIAPRAGNRPPGHRNQGATMNWAGLRIALGMTVGFAMIPMAYGQDTKKDAPATEKGKPAAKDDAKKNADTKDAKSVTAETAKSSLDFTMKDIDGKDVPLSKYKGKPVLIVNVASKCGL